MKGSTNKTWSHATETVVLQLDNTEEWQLHVMRLCRLENVSEASISIGEWFEENVFPEEGGEFLTAARTMFLEEVDWVEVSLHFHRKTLEAYKASEDEEASEIIDRFVELVFGDDYVETHYISAVVNGQDIECWFLLQVVGDGENSQCQVYRVIDSPRGPGCGLDILRLSEKEEREWLERWDGGADNADDPDYGVPRGC